MAKIEMTTRNGDKVPPIITNDPDEIHRLENLPFDQTSNIAHTHVTGD